MAEYFKFACCRQDHVPCEACYLRFVYETKFYRFTLSFLIKQLVPHTIVHHHREMNTRDETHTARYISLVPSLSTPLVYGIPSFCEACKSLNGCFNWNHPRTSAIPDLLCLRSVDPVGASSRWSRPANFHRCARITRSEVFLTFEHVRHADIRAASSRS